MWTDTYATAPHVSRGPRWQIFGLGMMLIAGGAVPAAAHEADGKPARIHAGSCEQMGAVAFSLNGVGASVDLDDAAVATPTTVNPERAATVMVSETTIDATLDEIVASDHAVMIYESDEEMSGVACGNVAGAMVGEQLIIGLGALGESGSSGFALFTPDGEQTTVTVLVGHDLAAGLGEGDHEESDEGGHEEADEADHEDAVPHDEEGTPAAASTPAA